MDQAVTKKSQDIREDNKEGPQEKGDQKTDQDMQIGDASSADDKDMKGDEGEGGASPRRAAGLFASVPPTVPTLSGILSSPTRSPFSATLQRVNDWYLPVAAA